MTDAGGSGKGDRRMVCEATHMPVMTTAWTATETPSQRGHSMGLTMRSNPR